MFPFTEKHNIPCDKGCLHRIKQYKQLIILAVTFSIYLIAIILIYMDKPKPLKKKCLAKPAVIHPPSDVRASTVGLSFNLSGQ